MIHNQTFGVSGSRAIPQLTSSKVSTKVKDGPNPKKEGPNLPKKQIREGRANRLKEANA